MSSEYFADGAPTVHVWFKSLTGEKSKSVQLPFPVTGAQLHATAKRLFGEKAYKLMWKNTVVPDDTQGYGDALLRSNTIIVLTRPQTSAPEGDASPSWDNGRPLDAARETTTVQFRGKFRTHMIDVPVHPTGRELHEAAATVFARPFNLIANARRVEDSASQRYSMEECDDLIHVAPLVERAEAGSYSDHDTVRVALPVEHGAPVELALPRIQLQHLSGSELYDQLLSKIRQPFTVYHDGVPVADTSTKLGGYDNIRNFSIVLGQFPLAAIHLSLTNYTKLFLVLDVPSRMTVKQLTDAVVASQLIGSKFTMLVDRGTHDVVERQTGVQEYLDIPTLEETYGVLLYH